MATGSVEASTGECVACGQERGHLYVGPVYAEGEYSGELCPWCIADGTAASRFDAEFTDVGWGVPEEVPTSVRDEVSRRTPGFESWQQDHWLYHCGDACAFLGRVGRHELDAYPDALDELRHEIERFGWGEARSEAYVEGLDASGDATAYLFRCLGCGTHLAFSDSA